MYVSTQWCYKSLFVINLINKIIFLYTYFPKLKKNKILKINRCLLINYIYQ
ncbi:hypothetical protein [Fowlpox virus]|uniref:Uncharacterized protein n=1 Tax=Fowlpox virus TaxID=10261 RepID=A0A891M0T9_FOWPV|nr:hypothetical protein [Fowlpox virus]UNS14308.1 ALPV-144 [Albatrosspox virus]UQT20401.1 hypothetical protein [Fowlpox virus]UQT20642.1 hypothetical protein [Fowlpox virus]WPD90810.1 hypothetical protein PPV_Vac110-(105-106)n1 [Avipoxvirus sp.]